MDCEALIGAIMARPQLWHNKGNNGSNYHITDELWVEISEVMNEPKENCRKKWKYLKDEYRKALRKVMESPGSEPYKPRFKYFNAMHFLQNDLIPNQRESQTNLCLDEIKLEESEVFSVQSSASTSSSLTKFRINKRRRSSTATRELIFPNIEEKQMKRTDKEWEAQEDSDLSFLKSLLPFFKDMQPIRKLTLRSNIQNLIVKALIEEDQ